VRLVDAQAANSPAPPELLLAGGHRLLIGADFDAAALHRSLGASKQRWAFRAHLHRSRGDRHTQGPGWPLGPRRSTESTRRVDLEMELPAAGNPEMQILMS
jgi:hypothetical protein